MDTSRNYYEAVMRDFGMYKRGRTLEQYCRDEAVDFQWLTKAQKQYGELEEASRKKKAFKPAKEKQGAMPGLIRLHYANDLPSEEGAAPSEPRASAESEAAPAHEGHGLWAVSSMTLTTPAGDDIEIRSRKPAAIAELLTKLAI